MRTPLVSSNWTWLEGVQPAHSIWKGQAYMYCYSKLHAAVGKSANPGPTCYLFPIPQSQAAVPALNLLRCSFASTLPIIHLTNLLVLAAALLVAVTPSSNAPCLLQQRNPQSLRLEGRSATHLARVLFSFTSLNLSLPLPSVLVLQSSICPHCSLHPPPNLTPLPNPNLFYSHHQPPPLPGNLPSGCYFNGSGGCKCG